jgi:hypothetical protein
MITRSIRSAYSALGTHSNTIITNYITFTGLTDDGFRNFACEQLLRATATFYVLGDVASREI